VKKDSTFSLTHKPVAFITGGARRIGAVIARHLHQHDYNLVIHYRHSAEQARALQEALHQIRPGSVLLIQADLAHVNQISPLVHTIKEHWGRLDVLVNNASSFYPTPIGKTSEEQWDDLLNSNLKAPFFLSQATTPLLREQQGCIVNLVDIHAMRPLKNHPVYCAAKAGLMMLTQALARELGPEIRVNGIAPGAIMWPENNLDQLARQRIIAQTALKRSGSPQDIAQTVYFLIAQAGYMTGQIITVDGGRSLGSA